MEPAMPKETKPCCEMTEHNPVWAGDGYFCEKCMVQFKICHQESTNGQESPTVFNINGQGLAIGKKIEGVGNQNIAIASQESTKDCKDHYQKGHQLGINLESCTMKNNPEKKCELCLKGATYCPHVSPTPQTEWEAKFDFLFPVLHTSENTDNDETDVTFEVKHFIRTLLQARDEEVKSRVRSLRGGRFPFMGELYKEGYENALTDVLSALHKGK